ncbi:mucin-3A-like isoform X23 [Schistocerca cancellata]|uniref:mucin-3A-like isoform X23 n=1 Tax=Schistocerca cancellata TaxID=274614 RepID=UPI002118F4C9|nr:mucin-3A-like isoform X23 [Schistocerca cancellata]
MAPPRALLAIATLCSALVAARAAAPNANCDLLFDGNPVSSSSWSSALNASRYVGDLVDTAEPQAEYLVLTTKEVTAFAVDSPSDYIDVVFDEAASTLKLVVKEEFANYEEQMISASDPSIIDIRITLTCSDTNTAGFGFKITVKDTNNHPPEFDKSSYPFELPMPLPSDIDLSCLVDVIKVTDIDFSNSDITIEFDEDGAKLFRGEATYLGSRNYEIHVYSTTAIELKETTTFTMTAKDNGSPQQSSSPATITINVNQQTSPPTAPTFQPAASHKTVAADEIVPGTEVASVTISEGYGTDVEVTHYTLDEAGVTPTSDAFAVDVTAASDGTATVSLRWAEGVAPESLQDLKYALVVLQATRERDVSTNQVATTVVHLSLPGLQDPPTTGSTTDCSQCPTTVCPPTSPNTGLPTDATECPECPTTCPSISTTCPDTGSTTDCSQCPTTECPPTSPNTGSPTDATECPECPTTCPSISTTWPDTGSTTDCSQCPATECPPTSPNTCSPSNATECPECPTTECPPTSPDTGSSTDATECPECPTTCPSISTTGSDTGSTTDCSQCPTTECPPTSPNTGSDSSECPQCPTTCTTCEPCTTAEPTSTTPALPPGPPIEFERSRYRDTVSSVYVGTLANLTLKDYDSEGHTLDCQLLDATDYVASRVSVHPVGVAGCQLTIDAFLRAGSYAFSVRANLAGTSSVATTEVALAVSTTITCDDSTSPIFPIALLVTSQPENQTAAANILPPTELGDGARCSFNHSVDPAEYSDWVQVDKATGEMNVTDLDYESVTSLFISLSVSCESEPEQQQQQQQPRRLRRTKDQPDWPEYLLYDNTSMSVLLQIQDVNDNPPVFTAGDRIVVGYPTGDLLERVQPGPVVTLKATDADEGENAELRYSLDAAGSRHFTVGAETGAVYVRADAPELPDSGVSFTATVADLAGAAGALSDTVVVQVKPLKDEELVLVTTVEGALPEDADAVVEDLCGATGLNVRLLRAYAAAAEEGRALAGGRAARAASGSATTMLLYALDDQEALVTVQQFQTLLSSSEIKVENLPPEAENQEPTDVTGYMAAIITLAVLIAVALGGAVAGYYFYFRPRLGVHKQTDDYTKFESDADKDSPLESQIPQITTTVEPKISTVSEIIEPVNEVTVENNIITDENSNGVLAPDSEDDWSRKRSMTIRGGPDDYNDEEASGEPRRSESSDSLDGDEAHAESERRKSAVHFNENVECIEVERL